MGTENTPPITPAETAAHSPVNGTESIVIKHTRQNGTLVFGTSRATGAGLVLHGNGFRTSRNLDYDEEMDEAPFWYMPHSRRRSAPWKVYKAVEQLREDGFTVDVRVDDTTPATGFDDLETERNDRAEARAERYADRAHARAEESETIFAANRRTYGQLNGTPILIGHYSEGAHRRLMERLWNRESKAWELYHQAKDWRSKATSAARYRHGRENVATTLRRIKGLEKRLRDIATAMEGRIEVLWDNPFEWPGPLDEQLATYRDKGIPVTVLKTAPGSDGTSTVRVHIGVSEHSKAVYAAETYEITDEIAYWEAVVEASGVKVWTRADFNRGDFVAVGGDTWYEVVRVNNATLSVAALFDRDAGPVRTLASLQERHRGSPSTQKVPYDKVTGKMTGEEARTRFPAAFAAALDDGAAVPKRPAKKRGKAKITHQPTVQGESWCYKIGGTAYRAYWPHPDGWHTSTAASKPITGDIPPVEIFEEVVLIGKPDVDTGQRITVPGPLHYVEQVHNLVRAFVEDETKAHTPADA